MKKLIALVAVVAACVFAASASADTNRAISGTNCSYTAYTPGYFQGDLIAATGISCGGSEYNWWKDAYVCIQVHNANGNWYNVYGSCYWVGWTTAAPDQSLEETQGVAGHVYRTYSGAQVKNGGSLWDSEGLVSQGYVFP